MTGHLSHAAASEHLHDLRAAAGTRGLRSRKQRPQRRRPALAGLHRPRRALAA